MSQNLQSFKTWFAAGAVILLIGLVLQWYPSSVIGGMRERLTQSDVTSAERAATQEDLNSWKIQQITLLQPASLGFVAGGILMLIYSVLSALFS
jgi:hypothetical protein